MTVRTTQSQVMFLNPFCLDGMDQPLPPGIYLLLSHQDELHGATFVTYRTTAAFLQVPALGKWSAGTRLLAIALDDLESCLCADRAAVHLRLVVPAA